MHTQLPGSTPWKAQCPLNLEKGVLCMDTALSFSQTRFPSETRQDPWLPPAPLASSPAAKAGEDGKLFLGFSPGISPDLSFSFLGIMGLG